MKPIKKNNISEQVFESIMGQIIKGEWKPGEKIPSENELAAILDVSRISVRAALQKLTTLGLLDARQGEGTYVKELDPGIHMNSLIPMLVLSGNQTMQVMEFRRAIEIETAGIAADKATDEDIENLEEIFKKMVKHQDDRVKFVNEDLNFHVAFAEMTRNPVIVRVFYIIKDIFGASIIDINRYQGKAGGLYFHKKLLEAIKTRDRNLTKKVMEEHILDSIDALRQIENKKTV